MYVYMHNIASEEKYKFLQKKVSAPMFIAFLSLQNKNETKRDGGGGEILGYFGKKRGVRVKKFFWAFDGFAY